MIFDKYEQRGAYHWAWYKSNIYRYQELVDSLIEFLPKDGGYLLDIGCGDGLIGFKIFQRGMSVLGIDNNACAIALANATMKKKRKELKIKRLLRNIGLFRNDELRIPDDNLKFKEQSIYDLSEDTKYDYVLCYEVLEHIENPEKVLDKIKNVCKKMAVTSIPNGEFQKKGKYDYHLWKKEEFEKILDNHGLNYSCLLVDEEKIYFKLNFGTTV